MPSSQSLMILMNRWKNLPGICRDRIYGKDKAASEVNPQMRLFDAVSDQMMGTLEVPII
jgi:hypothetical protein